MKIHEIIMELGDSPHKYNIIRNTARTFIATSDDIEVEFAMYPHNGQVEIFFSVDDSMEITGKGNAFKIFSTVGKIIVDNIERFLEKNATTRTIYFTAESKEPSRIRLYDKLVPYISKILGKEWNYSGKQYSGIIVKYEWHRK